MLCDGGSAPTHLGQKGCTQPRLLMLEVLNSVVEFALGQLIEGDAHRLDPRLGLAKHLVGGATG